MTDEIKTTRNQPTPTDSDYAWLENMPDAIRDWLGSSELTFLIMGLSRRLGFDGIKVSVVPNLILQVVLKELSPEKLAESLGKKLGLDSAGSAAVAKEVEEKMLRPIENQLRRDLGVDIKMIYAGIQSTQPRPSNPPAPAAQPIYRPAPPVGGPPIYRPAPPAPPAPITPSAPKEIPVKINVQPVRQAQGEKPPADQPFGPDSWVNKVK